MKTLILITIFLISIDSSAQYPGAFYGFELKGPDGKIVDSLSKDYKLYLDTIAPGPYSIDLCEDNKTWRLYKGDVNLSVASFLTIEKLSEGNTSEKMHLKFPPPMTGGKDKYYAHLYIGVIKFIPGTYKIKFPKTRDDWDSLEEREICPDPYNHNIYLDISKYQKIK